MSGLLGVARAEFARIFQVRPAFAAMVAALAIYAVLYPQPYTGEQLRDVPLAIVDLDGTPASRDLARRVDATEAVLVAATLPDMAAAERALQARQVYGVLLIPREFERGLLRGAPSPVALYGDASFFLLYQRVSVGVGAAARALGAEVETGRLIAGGIDPALAAAAADPMPLVQVPLFNSESGYGTYILPAAFILILQQTLLTGVGVLGTSAPRGATAGAGTTVAGKLLAYLLLYAVLLPLYVILLPWLYGIPRLGSPASLLVLAVPFVLAASLLGMTVASLLRRPEVVQLTLLGVGLPFFFLSGFSWPPSAMPAPIAWAAHLVPSTAAIEGFVRLGQMGATPADIRGEIANLWLLVPLYGLAAVLLQRRAAAPRLKRPLPDPPPLARERERNGAAGSPLPR